MGSGRGSSRVGQAHLAAGRQRDGETGVGWERGLEEGNGGLYLRGPSAGSAAMHAASWQDAEAARLTHV